MDLFRHRQIQQQKNTYRSKCFSLVKGGQKRYFGEFLYGLELMYQITPKGVYIINAKHCISSRRNLVYHHCERGYSLRLMIYTFGDEIHAKAWWYTIAFAMDKKFDKSKLVDFWCGRRARREKQLITVFRERSQQSKEKWSKAAPWAHFDYATWQGTKSWKFVGQAEAKVPKLLENTGYFGTAKITKTCISNVISNTFQNHNLIRRNIEAVTTRRSWKPFAQKARGFESLFLRQIKGQPSPQSSVVFLFLWHWYERIWTALCDSLSRRMGFAYPTRRSKSSLFRRRVWVSSSKTNTPLPSLPYKLEFVLLSNQFEFKGLCT